MSLVVPAAASQACASQIGVGNWWDTNYGARNALCHADGKPDDNDILLKSWTRRAPHGHAAPGPGALGLLAMAASPSGAGVGCAASEITQRR